MEGEVEGGDEVCLLGPSSAQWLAVAELPPTEEQEEEQQQQEEEQQEQQEEEEELS